MLWVNEPKATDSLFEESSLPQKSFRSYITRCETSLLTTTELGQLLALIAFKRGILTVGKRLDDHHMIDGFCP